MKTITKILRHTVLTLALLLWCFVVIGQNYIPTYNGVRFLPSGDTINRAYVSDDRDTIIIANNDTLTFSQFIQWADSIGLIATKYDLDTLKTTISGDELWYLAANKIQNKDTVPVFISQGTFTGTDLVVSGNTEYNGTYTYIEDYNGEPSYRQIGVGWIFYTDFQAGAWCINTTRVNPFSSIDWISTTRTGVYALSADTDYPTENPEVTTTTGFSDVALQVHGAAEIDIVKTGEIQVKNSLITPREDGIIWAFAENGGIDTALFAIEANGVGRFAIPIQGAGFATQNYRSLLVGSNGIIDLDSACYVGYAGFDIDFIPCNTDAFGADLGVEHNLHVLGSIRADSVLFLTNNILSSNKDSILVRDDNVVKYIINDFATLTDLGDTAAILRGLISDNADDIASNATNIGNNVLSIASNLALIQDNDSNIASNYALISDNTDSIIVHNNRLIALEGAGYITTETDPVWTADKSNYYTSTQVNNLPVSTFTNDVPYLTSYTETDPIWTADKPQYLTALQVQALPISTFTNDVPYITSYENNYVNAGSFNTVTGELVLSGVGLAGATVDLDGRYLTAYSETDPLYTADKPSILFWSDTLTDIATSYDLSQLTDTKVTGISFSGATLQLQQTGLPSLTADIDTTATIATKFDVSQVSGGSKWVQSGSTIEPVSGVSVAQIDTDFPSFYASGAYANMLVEGKDFFGTTTNGFIKTRTNTSNAITENTTLGRVTYSAKTTSPTSIDVSNAAYIDGVAAESWTNTGIGTKIQFYTAQSGTTTPAKQMEIDGNGDVIVTNDIGADSIKETTKISYNSLYGVPADGWTLDGDTISTDKLVGIGTTSPETPLHINQYEDNFAIKIYGYDDVNTYNGAMFIDAFGGLVLKASDKCTYRSDSYQFFQSFNDNIFFKCGSGKDFIFRNSSNVSIFQIDEATGAVGIGTASPTSGYKLDVNGDAIIQGISAATQAHESDTIRSLSNNTALIIEGKGTGIVRVEDSFRATGQIYTEGNLTVEDNTKLEGGVSHVVKAIPSSSYTIQISDYYIYLHADSTFNATLTLPSSPTTGQTFIINNENNGQTIKVGSVSDFRGLTDGIDISASPDAETPKGLELYYSGSYWIVRKFD